MNKNIPFMYQIMSEREVFYPYESEEKYNNENYNPETQISKGSSWCSRQSTRTGVMNFHDDSDTKSDD